MTPTFAGRPVRCAYELSAAVKVKAGHFAIGLTPAVDLVSLARIEHVAALIPGRGIARQHVDAVHRGDRQQPAAAYIADLDAVAGAGRPRDPVLTLKIMRRDGSARVPVDEADPRQAPQCRGVEADRKSRSRGDTGYPSHTHTPVRQRLTQVKRYSGACGVNGGEKEFRFPAARLSGARFRGTCLRPRCAPAACRRPARSTADARNWDRN